MPALISIFNTKTSNTKYQRFQAVDIGPRLCWQFLCMFSVDTVLPTASYSALPTEVAPYQRQIL